MSQEMCDLTEDSEAKDVHSQPPEDKAISDCLGNPVIVRKILENYCWFYELLPLSLVNKLWNYEARSLIRKRGSKVVSFSSGHDLTGGPQPCQEIVSFIAALPKMNVVPFSGLRIHLNGPAHRDVFPPQALLDLSHKSLDRLSLKKFTVQLWGKSPFDKFSPCFLLTKKVLQNVGRVLQVLKLGVSQAELMDRIVQDCSFPNLKILKIKDDYEDNDSTDTINEPFSNLVKSLVARSPILQELHTDGPLNLDVFGGSSSKLVYKHTIFAPFDEIPENFNVQLRLKRVKFEYFGPEFDMERFNRATPKLLRKCCRETLRHVDMDVVLAVPFMCFGIKLENVKDFYLSINFSQLELVEPRILRIVKEFDFTRLVPNVTKVEIWGGNEPEFSLLPDHMNTIIEQADAFLEEPMPDRAANIKQLKIYTSLALTDATALFFAQMFPSIEQLEVHNGHESIGYVWKHWVCLKDLKVWLSAEEENALNLDSVFCGIFPEEVAELREKDEEFLKRVNIVPVMPAITCMRSLTSLTLCYRASSLEPVLNYLILDDYLENSDESTLIFSKVTGLLAFGRRPDLRVTLEARSGDMWSILGAMNHLKPYASVTFSLL